MVNLQEGLADSKADMRSNLFWELQEIRDIASSNHLIAKEEATIIRKIVKQVSTNNSDEGNGKMTYPVLNLYFKELINGPILTEVVENQGEI